MIDREAYAVPKWFVTFVTATILLAIPWCTWVTLQLLDQRTTFALQSLAADLAEIKGNRWTIAMEAEATLRTAILNPGMELPDPRDSNKIIVVSKGKITYDSTKSNSISH